MDVKRMSNEELVEELITDIECEYDDKYIIAEKVELARRLSLLDRAVGILRELRDSDELSLISKSPIRALLTEIDADSPRPAKPNMGDDPKWLHSMINSINETINAEMEKRARYEKRLDTLQQNAEIDTEEPDAR